MEYLPLIFQICTRAAIIVATVYFYSKTLEPKHGFNSMLLSVGLVLATAQIVYVIWPSLYYLSSDAAPFWSMLCAAAEAVVVIGVLKGSTKSSFMQIVLFYSLGLLTAVLSSLLPFAFFGLFTGESVPVLIASKWNDFSISFISAVLHVALLIALSELSFRFIKRQSVELRWTQFAPVIGAQAVSLILCAALPRQAGGALGLTWTALAVLLVIYGVADAVLIQSFRAFIKNSELSARLVFLDQQRQQQHAYYLSLGEQLKTVQRLRHDYRNTLETIRTLINRGDVAKAEQLACECSGALQAGTTRVYTGNDTLDAVLNNKAQMARQAGIDFEIEICLPAMLNISDMDLMSIFTNLLDNAIEYLETLPTTMVRRICLSGKVKAGFWILNFSNTFLGESVPSFKTTKKDQTLHGHGQTIVRSILTKYDGTFYTSVANGLFTVSVALNMVSSTKDIKEKMA